MPVQENGKSMLTLSCGNGAAGKLLNGFEFRFRQITHPFITPLTVYRPRVTQYF